MSTLYTADIIQLMQLNLPVNPFLIGSSLTQNIRFLVRNEEIKMERKAQFILTMQYKVLYSTVLYLAVQGCLQLEFSGAEQEILPHDGTRLPPLLRGGELDLPDPHGSRGPAYSE